MRFVIILLSVALPFGAFAAPPTVEPAQIVLIAVGDTKQITVNRSCKRVTNHARVTIGIEVGSLAKWPDVFDGTHPHIKVVPCR